MKFHEFGDKNLPPILLIHGGGSSWWNYLRQARILSGEYRVILPTLNGHGEEYQLDYVSTEDSALEILDYIKENCGGKLFAIGGVSLGGQIAMELLSIDSDVAEKAIIDGSLCIPQPGLVKISIFLSLSRQLLFLLPLLVLLPNFYGINGVWASMPTSDLISVIVAISIMTVYLQRFKKEM